MIEIPSLRPETRYGMPMADQLLFNREYIVGYSNLFRQPRWVMEVIDPDNKAIGSVRVNSFRPDLRVPEKFRAELDDYAKTGFDRGHLVSSADRRATETKNSETFLLTNMSPQVPGFNRGIWKKLEGAVRDLSNLYVEVYVICGPLFAVGKQIEQIGVGEVKVPVPHAYFKSVLAEKVSGSMDLWSFILDNEPSDKPLAEFRATTREVEIWAGVSLWDRLRGADIEAMKLKKSRMWGQVKAAEAAKKREAEKEASPER